MTNQFVVDSLYQEVKEISMDRLNLPRKEKKYLFIKNYKFFLTN
jgi:hypothetical protein